MFRQKIKRYGVLCRKTHGVYHVLKTIKIKNMNQKTIKYGNSSYLLDQSKPSNAKGLNIYYYINIDDNCQMQFDSVSQIDSVVLDTLISDKLVRSMTDSLKIESGFSMDLKNILIGLFIGIFAALTVMLILMQTGVL